MGIEDLNRKQLKREIEQLDKDIAAETASKELRENTLPIPDSNDQDAEANFSHRTPVVREELEDDYT